MKIGSFSSTQCVGLRLQSARLAMPVPASSNMVSKWKGLRSRASLRPLRRRRSTKRLRRRLSLVFRLIRTQRRNTQRRSTRLSRSSQFSRRSRATARRRSLVRWPWVARLSRWRAWPSLWDLPFRRASWGRWAASFWLTSWRVRCSGPDGGSVTRRHRPV